MSKKRAVYAICDGLIHATIWGHDGKHGRRYEFTLGRAYGVGDHAFRYAATFHEQDAEALSRVIKRTAGAIREASESSENTEAEPARIDLALKAAKRYARLLNIGAWEERRPAPEKQPHPNSCIQTVPTEPSKKEQEKG